MKDPLRDDDEVVEDQSPTIQILVEIVSASELLDYRVEEEAKKIFSTEDSKKESPNKEKTLNPYIKVKYKNEVIHKTKKINNSSNPIWTINSGHIFIFSTTLEEVSKGRENITDQSNHLRFEVQSKGILDSELIGAFSISPIEILEKYCNEKRFVFKIYEDTKSSSKASGYLALRFRVATEQDVEFVEAVKKKFEDTNLLEQQITKRRKSILLPLTRQDSTRCTTKPFLVTEKDETEILVEDLSEGFKAVTRQLFQKSIPKKAIKPNPDPKRPEATKLMTEKEIQKETFLSPSHHWVKAGTGSLGKIYFEVLACHDLPNVDVHVGNIGDVTDAFVSIVYEDVLVQTPVINNELSPRWLPWTQRAFIFHTMSPSSVLFLSVCNFNLGLAHDHIGRVAINPANFKKDVLYTLKYDLFHSSNMSERVKKGSVTVRLRIESNNYRRLLLDSVICDRQFFLNTKKERTFKVARFTCLGEHGDENILDMTILQSYIDEMYEYMYAITSLFSEVFTTIMFWRGCTKFGSIMIPTHSIGFYSMGLFLTWNPSLVPAVFFFTIAFGFLACMEARLNHPSPWNKCISFAYFFRVLLHGNISLSESESTIQKNTNLEEILKYEKAIRDRKEQEEAVYRNESELREKIRKDIGSHAITTSDNAAKMQLSIMRRAARFQVMLGDACRFMRKVKMALTWEDSYFSFWASMFFFGLGIFSVLLPVSTILINTFKALFILLFGPWMKLVDIYFQDKSSERSIQLKTSEVVEKSRAWRRKAEKVKKFKETRKYRYGDYIMNVPSKYPVRHYDCPLPESTAEPISACERLLCTKEQEARAGWINGQCLYGKMILGTENEVKQNSENSAKARNKILAILNDKPDFKK